MGAPLRDASMRVQEGKTDGWTLSETNEPPRSELGVWRGAHSSRLASRAATA